MVPGPESRHRLSPASSQERDEVTIRYAFRLHSITAALTLAGCLPAATALSLPAHADPTGPDAPDRRGRAAHHPASAQEHAYGGAGPFRLSGDGGETKQFQTKTVQVCFNTWGNNLEKGYTIGIYKSTWSGRRKVWGIRYYGPKNKTCSPWTRTGGETWAQLGSLSSVTGDFWVYWT